MSILVVQGHGVAPEVKLKATLLGLQHGQSHPWLGSGVQCHQETVPHLNFHVLELGKLVAAVCYSDTFCHLLLELHRTLVCFLSDYCHWLSLSGISPGLHSHLHSGL